MPENSNLSLIVNNPDDLPSHAVSPLLKWNGLDVTYLSTAFSQYPIHNHRFIQITVPLQTTGLENVTLSEPAALEAFKN